MVFHAAEILTESGKKTGKIIRLFNKDTIWPENKLFYGSGKTNATASIMYRKKFMDNPPKWYFNTPVDDTPLALILSTKGTIAYIDEFMSVYRVGVLGSWNSQVHKNKEKMKMVLKKLIVMLDEFNKYSKYKYDEDIKYKKLELEIKLISFDSKINLISFMKHQKVILYLKKYSFLRKVKFVSKLYFPRVYEILSSYKFYINLYFNNFKCKLLKRKVK